MSSFLYRVGHLGRGRPHIRRFRSGEWMCFCFPLVRHPNSRYKFIVFGVGCTPVEAFNKFSVQWGAE